MNSSLQNSKVYVVDANLLLRFVDKTSLHHSTSVRAFKVLKAQGAELVIPAQALHEFYAVATRPSTARGGLGLPVQQALKWIRVFRRIFRILPESSYLSEWEDVLGRMNVIGLNAHDARYIAVMRVERLTHLLTFNIKDFQRYTAEGIIIVDPETV